ncbi:MAG: AsmA-like C-terminal region-containing protein [Flavobacteriales bacterium]
MKKVLKIIVVVIVLLLISAIALPFVFSGKIEQAVKNAVNENVNAEVNWTDYGLSLFKSFPNMTVTLDSLDVTGKAEFEGIKLANIPKMEVSLDIMSLFGDSAQVNSFKLVDPYINVQVMKDGTANYDIALASDEIEEAVEEELPAEGGSFRLALDNYEIENGTVSYLDESLGMMLYLEGLNHKGSGDFTSSVIDLKTKTTASEFDLVYDKITYINKATTDLDLNMLMDMDKMRFDIQGNELFLNDLKLVAEGFIEMPGEDIDMDITYAAPETNIKQLVSLIPKEFRGDLAGVNAKGELKLDGFVRGVYNARELPAVGLDIKIADGFLQYPDLPEAITNIGLDAVFSMPQGSDLDAIEIAISKLDLNVADNPISTRINLTKPFTTQNLDASLKANLNFEKLAKAFPLEDTKLNGLLDADVALQGSIADLTNQDFSKFNAKGYFDIKDMNVDASDTYQMNISEAHFDVTPASIAMPAFKGKIGDSDITADGRIENFLSYAFDDEVLKGAFNVQSNLMDMKDFMTSDESTETSLEASGETDVEMYVDVPENLQFDLNADIKKLIYDGTELTNVTGKVKVDDGTAGMENVNLNFLGGSIILDGSYSTKDREQPLLDVDYDLNNLDITKFTDSFEIIAMMAPIAKYCSGKFGSKLSFSSELGKDMFPIYESISADGNVTTNAVEIDKFKPLTELASKLKISKLNSQRLENLKMAFTVKDGTIAVTPFETELDGMKTTVSGSANFNQEIDYDIKMDVPFSKLPQQGTEFATDLLNKVNKLGTNFNAGQIIPITVKVTGTFTDPKLSLSGVGTGMVTDIKEEVKEQVKQVVEEKVNEVKEDLTGKAKEEADKIMVTATEQANKVRSEGIKLADKGKEEAYKAAQQLEDAAKKPWEKVGAKLAADKARKKADETHTKAVNKTNEKADKIISDAQERANSLLDK